MSRAFLFTWFGEFPRQTARILTHIRNLLTISLPSNGFSPGGRVPSTIAQHDPWLVCAKILVLCW